MAKSLFNISFLFFSFSFEYCFSFYFILFYFLIDGRARGKVTHKEAWDKRKG